MQPDEPGVEPTFHEFASEWFETRRHEFATPTREDYELTLTRLGQILDAAVRYNLLPFNPVKWGGSRS